MKEFRYFTTKIVICQIAAKQHDDHHIIDFIWSYLLIKINTRLAMTTVTFGDFSSYISMEKKTYMEFKDGIFDKEIGIFPLRGFWLRTLLKLPHPYVY